MQCRAESAKTLTRSPGESRRVQLRHDEFSGGRESGRTGQPRGADVFLHAKVAVDFALDRCEGMPKVRIDGTRVRDSLGIVDVLLRSIHTASGFGHLEDRVVSKMLARYDVEGLSQAVTSKSIVRG